MNWLSDLWFDLCQAWLGFRFDRRMHKEYQDDWESEVLRLREKGL